MTPIDFQYSCLGLCSLSRMTLLFSGRYLTCASTFDVLILLVFRCCCCYFTNCDVIRTHSWLHLAGPVNVVISAITTSSPLPPCPAVVTTPAPPECQPSEWRCTSGECIQASERCDRKYDCRDGTDEFNCGMFSWLGKREYHMTLTPLVLLNIWNVYHYANAT